MTPDQQTATIKAMLAQIEKDHQVHILYACESGSRAWGFASPNSDYDVRFLYVRPQEAYLSLDTPRDVIELPIEDDLDIAGWDIFKALRLLRKSNVSLLEWLCSPLVYQEHPLVGSLRGVALAQFSPLKMRYHYWHLAQGQWQHSLRGKSEVSHKKYLYALRPLVALVYLEQFRVWPPTSFVTTLASVRLPGEVRTRIQALIAEKKAGNELGTGTSDPLLHDFIEEQLARVDLTPPVTGDTEQDAMLHKECEGWLSQVWDSQRATPPVWEHIDVMQQYIREQVEARWPGHRVTEISADVYSYYSPTLATRTEPHPDYVLGSTVAHFRVALVQDGPPHHPRTTLYLPVLLGTDGRIETGQASITM